MQQSRKKQIAREHFFDQIRLLTEYLTKSIGLVVMQPLLLDQCYIYRQHFFTIVEFTNFYWFLFRLTTEIIF